MHKWVTNIPISPCEHTTRCDAPKIQTQQLKVFKKMDDYIVIPPWTQSRRQWIAFLDRGMWYFTGISPPEGINMLRKHLLT